MIKTVLTGTNVPIAMVPLDQPELNPNQVWVNLQAAALNHRDVWIQKGQYAGLKFPITLGSDGAGTITAVGTDVDAAWVGADVVLAPGHLWGNNEAFQARQYEILGLPADGTFSQGIAVTVDRLVHKPAHLTALQAAALPLAGLTAYRAVVVKAQVKPQQKVLVTGIGGGVALFAMQIALALGAEVWVTSGHTAKIEKAMALGASGGWNYNDTAAFKQYKDYFNAIIDGAAGTVSTCYPDILQFGGHWVMYGGTAGNIPHLNPQRIFWKQLNLLGTTMGSPKDFNEWIQFVAQHQLQPVVDIVFPLADLQEAMHYMDKSAQFGKIVLNCS